MGVIALANLYDFRTMTSRGEDRLSPPVPTQIVPNPPAPLANSRSGPGW